MRLEHTHHHLLIGGLGILKTERHHVVAIHPARRDKGGFQGVKGEQEGLVVSSSRH